MPEFYMIFARKINKIPKFQIGLKIHCDSAYNFAASGSNVTKLFHAMCPATQECSSGHNFWGRPAS